MTDTNEPRISVTWTERRDCEHRFTLTEARAFLDLRGSTPPEGATPEQIVAALKEMDLPNALAEIDDSAITFVDVYRDIENVAAI